MTSLPSEVRAFVNDSIAKYSGLGYIVTLHPGDKIVKGSMVYTGEATAEKLEIAVGGDWREWLGILVHETCHLDQHRGNPDVFDASEKSLDSLVGWIEGKNVPPPVSDFFRVVELEGDCEQRAVDKIKHFNLPLNTHEYTQKANVYLGSYAVSLRHRVWVPQPYRHAHLCACAEPSRVLSRSEVFATSANLPPDSEYLNLVTPVTPMKRAASPQPSPPQEMSDLAGSIS
jgi:hypothetical protein